VTHSILVIDPFLCLPGGFFRQQKLKRDGQPKLDSNGQPEFKYRQKNPSRTRNDIRYIALALAGRTIIGAQFQTSRIDAFSLGTTACSPRARPGRTKADVRTSPFRMFVSNGVLYVGAGTADQVQAYRLDANGLPESNGTPFAETNRLRNTFRNDGTVVDISGSCDWARTAHPCPESPAFCRIASRAATLIWSLATCVGPFACSPSAPLFCSLVPARAIHEIRSRAPSR
jgi:hypothetical protein